LSTCAGIAIVKPHFPFYGAYHLAEALLKSAKAVKTGMCQVADKPGEGERAAVVSSLDYHVLYDASGADLKEIRDRMKVGDQTVWPWCRPIIVTRPAAWGSLRAGDEAWAERRTLGGLARRVRALQAKDQDGRRKLPTSLTHDLREAVFQKKEEADARLKVAWDRYAGVGLAELSADGANTDRSAATLFWAEQDEEGQAHQVTALVDAIELDGFWTPDGEEEEL